MKRSLSLAARGAAACTLALSAAAAGAAPVSDAALLARGAHLVDTIGCADCHTPSVMGPNGPQKDLALGFAGHPQALDVSPPPAPAGGWIWGGSASMTAFHGPWGVSYASNLTPDAETGLGHWSLEQFIATMRSGRHLGSGRPLLPPMPWQGIGKLDDGDLAAMFAYLQSLPAVANRVPGPLPPVMAVR